MNLHNIVAERLFWVGGRGTCNFNCQKNMDVGRTAHHECIRQYLGLPKHLRDDDPRPYYCECRVCENNTRALHYYESKSEVWNKICPGCIEAQHPVPPV